jgi:hypothetical protein
MTLAEVASTVGGVLRGCSGTELAGEGSRR